MTQKNETPVLILSLLITLGLIGGGWWFFNKNKPSVTNDSQPSIETPDRSGSQNNNVAVESLISKGNRILIAEDSNDNKKMSVSAIAKQNYEQAISLLENSLSTNRNDPEALIYLNNARIGSNPAYNLVTSIPISSNLNVAREMLRGVAQAQDEINRNGGIAGKSLKIAIADDSNDPQIAQQLARSYSKNKEFLGVIGHFSSEITLAAAPIYQENGLVAISPTSTSVELSGASQYVFRTVPSDRYAGNALAKYFLETLKARKAAIVYSSQSSYSKSLQNIFKTEILSGGGEIVTEFDFAQPNFNVADLVQKAQQEGAEALILLPGSAYLDTVNDSLAIIQLNNGKLPILAGDALYRPETLKITETSGVNMVLAVPWHLLNHSESAFPQNATRLWGGDVNWRSALAYDATQVLAEAIELNPTRQGIQQALTSDNFSITGASGTVKFLPSGDRDKAVELVQIKPGDRSGYGVDFVPIP
jgi:branched-chain amino acid transport system substrate-binding protein